MKKFLLCLLAFPFALLAATPKNVIIMIPDGTGHASLTVTRQLKDAPLALDAAIYGIISTRSADNSVTDSAAAATAMACGQRTYNGAIGVNVQQIPLKSISERAHAQGKSVGIVTTDAITGATPSGFSAHVSQRSHAETIIEQQIASGFEVFFGGGAKYLTEDLKSYLAAQSYTFVATRDEMNAAEGKLFGLFASNLMTAEVERRAGAGASEPTLREMTTKALDLLARDPDGFFLMVEGAQIDKGNHEHDLPWATYECLEFDATVGLVLDWAKQHPDTLVLIAPDHETGGLTVLNEPTEGARGKALAAASGKTPQAHKTNHKGTYFVNYSTNWHTGVDVFLAGNTPSCRPARNCDILEAITGETAYTWTELKGQTLTENGITWLVTPEGKRLRAQRDAIYIKSTNKWYQR